MCGYSFRPVPAPRKKRSSSSAGDSPFPSPSQSNCPDLGSQEATPHYSHAPKQLPSLESTGSSGDSNIDPRSSNNSPSPATSAENLQEQTRSSSLSLKQKLEVLRQKRAQAAQKAGANVVIHSDQVSSLTISNDSQRNVSLKSKTASHSSQHVDFSTLSSMAAPPPLSTIPSSLSPAPSQPAIKRPPGKLPPTFYNDPILESEETSSQSSNLLPSSGSGQDQSLNAPMHKRCVSCPIMLSFQDKFCSQCGTQQLVHAASVTAPVKVKITPTTTSRAESARRLEQQEMVMGDFQAQRSAAIPERKQMGVATGGGSNPSGKETMSGMDELRMKEEAFKQFQERAESHSRTGTEPKPDASRQYQRADWPAQASGSSVAPSLEAQKPSSGPQSREASGQREHPSGRQSREASGQRQKDPPSGPQSREASGQRQNSGIDYLRQKEDAYKDSQRKKGVSEKDLQRLPETVEAEKKLAKGVEQQRRREQQEKGGGASPRLGVAGEAKKKLIDPKKYRKVDLFKNNYDQENEEANRMSQLACDGNELLDRIKVGTVHI